MNTAPMTLRPIVKDGGATIVRVKDVEKSPNAPRGVEIGNPESNAVSL